MHMPRPTKDQETAFAAKKLHTSNVAGKPHAPPGSALYVVHVARAGEDGSDLFVEMLKRRRKALRMSQESLADAAGVSRFSVMRWEGGDGAPEPDLIVPLARALQVDPLDVFRALGWLPLDADRPQLPDLPPELDRLAALYAQASKKDAAELLDKVGWVIEWYESRLVARDPNRTTRRAG
jgi:transcriptional regulator with XRE-family HTH domain